MFERAKIAALAGALCLTAGFGAGVASEYRAPFKLGPFPIPAGLAHRLSEAQSAARIAEANRAGLQEAIEGKDGWRGALSACEGRVEAAETANSSRVSTGFTARAGAASHAFDRGFEAARAICAADAADQQQETSHAPDSGSGGDGGGDAAALGLRPQAGGDFAQRWADRAYRPQGDVPGGG